MRDLVIRGDHTGLRTGRESPLDMELLVYPAIYLL